MAFSKPVHQFFYNYIIFNQYIILTVLVSIIILKENFNKIYWEILSLNPCAISLLEENPDKINWCLISSNANAIPLLKKNPDKIDWQFLCENPNGFNLLKENPDKIDWSLLSKNPEAIFLLEQNQDKIDWNELSLNPAIFTYDYEEIKKEKKELNEEILLKSLHPIRMLKLMQEYGEDVIYNCYFNEE